MKSTILLLFSFIWSSVKVLLGSSDLTKYRVGGTSLSLFHLIWPVLRIRGGLGFGVFIALDELWSGLVVSLLVSDFRLRRFRYFELTEAFSLLRGDCFDFAVEGLGFGDRWDSGFI